MNLYVNALVVVLLFAPTALAVVEGPTDGPNGNLASYFDRREWKRDTSQGIAEVENKSCTGTSPAGRSRSIDNKGGFSAVFNMNYQPKRKCRLEYKMYRRTGVHSMIGAFRFTASNLQGGVSIAQTHDNGEGSDGVFSIYQIRYTSGSNIYELMPQSDETSWGSSDWEPLRVEQKTWYFVDIQTYSEGADSFERIRVYKRDTKPNNWTSERVAEWWIDDDSGNSPDRQYKKYGAYLLSNSKADMIKVEWKNVEFWKE